MNLLLGLLAAANTAQAQPAHIRAGDCGWVRGRYEVSNGTRIHRIRPVGARRLLSLDIPDEGKPPEPLKRLYASGQFRPFHNRIFGDFYVCARESRKAGHMQNVHLGAVRRLRIVGY